jgi:hypothetical protein
MTDQTNNDQTNLRFVANQSAKLKLISFADFTDKANALYAEAGALAKQFTTIGSSQESEIKIANERAQPYFFMPSLLILSSIYSVPGLCVTTIDAEVRAATSPAKLIVNDALARAPGVVLWRNSYWLTGPNINFSLRVISVAERLMKEFVNDWSASQ